MFGAPPPALSTALCVAPLAVSGEPEGPTHAARRAQASTAPFWSARHQHQLWADPLNPGLNSPVDGNGKLKPEWLKLFQDFPERFVMGSDQHYPVPGDAIQRWQGIVALFNQLPADLRRRFGVDNPRYIYRLPSE